MTPQAQQRAIAIACGKTPSCAPDKWNDTPEHHEWREWQTQEKPFPFRFHTCKNCFAIHLEGERFVSCDSDHEVPDYLHDWNTRKEMLSVLVDRKLAKAFDSTFMNAWEALTITQPDFCKRFLGTIGQFVEETESQPCP